MSISLQDSQVIHTGNGSTSTPYPLTHLRFDDPSWLTVEEIMEDGTIARLEELGTDYSLIGDGVTASASLITIGRAIPPTSDLRVTRNTPLVQSANLTANAAIPAATLERMADWEIMALIDEKRRTEANLKRSLRVPDGEELGEISNSSVRADKFLGFDENGEPTVFRAADVAAQVDVDLASDLAAAQAAKNEAEAAQAGAEAAQTAAEMAVLKVARTIERNEGNLLNLRRCIRAMNNRSGTPGVVGLGSAGDSIVHSGGPWTWVTAALINLYGLGGLLSATLHNSRNLEATFDAPGLTPTLSGGANFIPTLPTDPASYLYTPTGQYFSVPSGGTVTESPRYSIFLTHWTSVKAIYGVKSSGGTLEFALKVNGVVVSTKTVSTAPGAVNAGAGMSTNGVAGSINTVEFVAADGLPICGSISLVTTGSVAVSHYIGTFVKREKGFVSVAFGRGGNSYLQHASIPDVNWTTLANIFNIQAWCHAQKGESQASIDAHLNKMKALFPGHTHICIGNTPVQIDPSGIQKNERNYWLEAAERNNFYFNDGWDYFFSWSEVENLGFQGDNIHLTDEARILWAEDIVDRVRVSAPIADTGGLSPMISFGGGTLMTAEEWAMRNVVAETTRSFPLLSDAADSTLPTGITKTLTKGVFLLQNSTSAAADTIGGVEISTADDYYGYDNFAWRFMLRERITSLFGTASPNGFVKIAAQAGFPVVGTINAAGFVWEFGIDVGPLPWIRFHLSDGTTHQISDKFYIPVTTHNFGYNVSGIVDHKFVVIYRSNGTLTKQIECWVAPTRSGQSTIRAEKPFLFALWRPTVAVYHVWTNGVSKLSFNIGSRNASPTANWNASLLSFEKDANIAFDAGWRNRHWNL